MTKDKILKKKKYRAQKVQPHWVLGARYEDMLISRMLPQGHCLQAKVLITVADQNAPDHTDSPDVTQA